MNNIDRENPFLDQLNDLILEGEARKSKVIKLFGVDVVLAERDAYDVMSMVNFSMQNRMKLTPEVFMIQTAKVLEAGLKYNYVVLDGDEAIRNHQKAFSFTQKRSLKKKLGAKYLLKHLSQTQLINLANQVYQLEGVSTPKDLESGKKKVKTRRKTSRKSANS